MDEEYPFQNTIKLLKNFHRMNDFMVEVTKQAEEDGMTTFSMNVLGMYNIVATNDVKNITHILKNVNIYGNHELDLGYVQH